MPTLKQLFGSPLGKHNKKKKNNPVTEVTKSNSASTVNLSQDEDAAEERIIHESDYRDENNEVFDFWNDDDRIDIDDGNDYPKIMMPSISLGAIINVMRKEQHCDDNGDEVIDFIVDDDLRTTVMPWKSKEEGNDIFSVLKEEKDLNAEDDDFHTTIMSTNFEEKIAPDCSLNEDGVEQNLDDDFRSTLVQSKSNENIIANCRFGKDDFKQSFDDDDYCTTVMLTKSMDTNHTYSNVKKNEYEDDSDVDADFRTTVMPVTSLEAKETDEKQIREPEQNDQSHDYVPHESIENYEDDFRTTIMDLDFQDVSRQKKSSEVADDADCVGGSDGGDAYEDSPVNSFAFQKRIVGRRVQSGSSSSNSNSIGHFIQQMPHVVKNTQNTRLDKYEDSFDHPDIDVNEAEDDDGDEVKLLNFDDYRSTISVLTEPTTYVTFSVGNTPSDSSESPNHRRLVLPSPTSSSISAAGTKKMEDFLKTETEALRQLLSTVESGDDEGTVVEEAVRGANEAERMAREMEREMELLVGRGGLDNHFDTEDDGNSNDLANGEHNHILSPSDDDELVPVVRPLDYRNFSPESTEFLSDIRSVMHPVASPPGNIAEKQQQDEYDENKSSASSSLHSRTTARSCCTRDLFRKRANSYKLITKTPSYRSRRLILKRRTKMKLRKLLRKVLLAIAFVLVICSSSFMVHWQWNHRDKDFIKVKTDTVALIQQQMSGVVLLDPEKREKAIAAVTNTTRATHAYVVQKQMELYTIYTPLADRTKLRVLDGIQDTTSLIMDQVTKYRPLVDQTKTRVKEGMRDTASVVVAHASNYGPWLVHHAKYRTMDGLRTTSLFVIDQLEYYVRNPETKIHLTNAIQATGLYLKDRLEYTFTDRAAREERIREEQKLQELLAAAAAAAAKETAEQQQMLWVQTMVAGACAFAGSVATNFLWSTM